MEGTVMKLYIRRRCLCRTDGVTAWKNRKNLIDDMIMDRKVLVVGGGGRCHAIVDALSLLVYFGIARILLGI